MISDLVEARIAVESAQAALAVVRATDDEIRELVSQFDGSSAAVDGHLSASAAETTGLHYHDFLARIAHNDILLVMSNGIRALYEPLVEDLDRSPDDLGQALRDHVVIADAVAARDPDGAALAMREHLLRNQRMFERSLAGNTPVGARESDLA